MDRLPDRRSGGRAGGRRKAVERQRPWRRRGDGSPRLLARSDSCHLGDTTSSSSRARWTGGRRRGIASTIWISAAETCAGQACSVSQLDGNSWRRKVQVSSLDETGTMFGWGPGGTNAAQWNESRNEGRGTGQRAPDILCRLSVEDGSAVGNGYARLRAWGAAGSSGSSGLRGVCRGAAGG